MQRLPFTLAAASFAIFVACSTEIVQETQPAMAWTDPVIETLDKGGVKVELFEKGTGAAASPGDQVSIHYTGWVRSTESVFDSSSYSGAPIGFELGTKQVIAGWDKGIEGMTTGTRARLHIPWKFGYGPEGNPRGGIPGKADLVFDVEVIKIR